MSQFVTLDGETCKDTDPRRQLWYGNCTYWTDDWSKLKSIEVKGDAISGGIPCCPVCGSPGFQMAAREWFDGAIRFEREGNPGYHRFLLHSQEQCHGRRDWMDWYKGWIKVRQG